MTTYSTNAGFSMATTAQQQAWVTEIGQGMLNIGLTQTGDTGQMAIPCTTVFGGATTTVYGYYMFRFNDALQGSAPIFFKIEVGVGSNVNIPLVYLTVGTGTNGSGTVTGVVMTRCAIYNNTGALTSLTLYISRFCYVPAQGFLSFAFKYGAVAGGLWTTWGGFLIYRSVNSSGAPTADSIHLLANSNNTVPSANFGTLQLINNNTSLAANNSTPIFVGTQWGAVPFSAASTSNFDPPAGLPQCFPIYQYLGSSTSSGYGMTNAAALAIQSEIGLFQTIKYQILGTTTLTYLSSGIPIGVSGGMSSPALAPGSYTLLTLWQ